MHIVIFEVIPLKEMKDRYFTLAAELKSELEKQPGFVSVERFQSLVNPDKYLSLSVWESEDAIKNWHQNTNHVDAQNKGHDHIFDRYHIRVASIYRDYDFVAEQTAD